MSCRRPGGPTPEYVAMMAALREARQRQDLSQQAVGFRIGRSSQAVCMWEAGTRIPSADDLLALAATLGVPLGIPTAVTT